MVKDKQQQKEQEEPGALEMLYLNNLQEFSDQLRSWVERNTINWTRAFNDLSARIDLMVDGGYHFPEKDD